MLVGIIAEEKEDVEVLEILIAKFVKENSFSTKRFVGHGCGKLRRKCSAWGRDLLSKGCELLIVVHDLDRNCEKAIRKELDKSISSLTFTDKIIIIPTEELEAWLLSDPQAIKTCFNLKKLPKTPKNPERTSSPKEHLRDLVWRDSGKRFLNTTHNPRIARAVDASTLAKCPSFHPVPVFLRKNFKKADVLC